MQAMADTGTGIYESTRGKIIEPFFTTKEMGKWTRACDGIGNNQTAQRICHVYSEPDKGMTFMINIPSM
jgi:two-component system, cell cycle sensor histidine kinase and response regulator CckA